MENKLPTQERLNKTYTEKRDEVVNKIRENINFIFIFLLIIGNFFLSILQVDGVDVKFNFPQNTLGWVFWSLLIIYQVVVAIAILNAFRRQGIKSGHRLIKTTHDQYLNLITEDKKQNPRSLKQYLKQTVAIDSTKKAITHTFLGVIAGTLLIAFDLNGLLGLIMNIIFAVSFGLKAMIESEEYVLEELNIWYKMKIRELQEENKNERQI